MFLKDEIKGKDKVINILSDNFPNRIPEHSNYITSKNTEVITQTEHQTKNNIQISTASNNHCTIIVSEKKKKKTTGNSMSISYIAPNVTRPKLIIAIIMKEEILWIRMIKNLKVKKLLGKSFPTLCIKKDLAQL